MRITLDQLLADVDPELLKTSEGRRALTKANPLLFAWLYLPHHITDHNGLITFAECHAEWADIALDWTIPATFIGEHRHAFLAPRNTGKSTWYYLIFPVFWAAFGYSQFMVAFANSDDQAQKHLETFRTELQTNTKLKEDFPDLCANKRRPNGMSEGDAKGMRISKSGFVFIAKGIDSQSLGLKVGNLRPDTILLDDIEPDEANYSLYKMEKRLSSLQQAILPLNERARIVLTGTVTMFGSLTHQLVKHANGSQESEWVKHQKFQVHHTKPIIDNGDGTYHSMWPEKWPIEWLLERRHTKEFKLNYENDPTAVDSEYWSDTDFTYDTFYTPNTYISIDGAVTTGAKSDYTGIAVVGCVNRIISEDGFEVSPKRALVKHASHVKLQGAELRKYVFDLIEQFPEINCLLVETNQGGDMWLETFHDMPIKIVTVHNSAKKEERAGRLLNLYQRIPTRVYHATYMSDLENEMMAFPRGLNDDMLDATGNAVLRFFYPPDKPKMIKRQTMPH